MGIYHLKISALILFISLSNLHSQTLQFSRAVLVEQQTETVPPGTIWKVNAFVPTSIKVSSTSPTSYNIVINGQSNPIGHSAFGNSGSSNASAWAAAMQGQTLPLWLPAGTTLASGSGIRMLSVLEFTVVP
jgi:hypothetical protein